MAKAKGFSRSDSVASDTHTIWGEVSSKPKVPDYDLALDKFKFTAVNSRTIKGLPQVREIIEIADKCLQSLVFVCIECDQTRGRGQRHDFCDRCGAQQDPSLQQLELSG